MAMAQRGADSQPALGYALISYGVLNFGHVSENAPRPTKIPFTLWRQAYRASGS
jgi:hypothetical protein